MTDAGINMLKRHEGLRLKVYKDSVGILTIGYGRNLEGKGISAGEAGVLLIHDILDTETFLQGFFPKWESMTPNRQDALTNMCFNLGTAGFSKFTKTIEFINNEQWEEASLAMLQSRWAEQVGNRAHELAELVKAG